MSRTKVFYVAGPGDVVSTYAYWRKGEQDPNESNVTYSGQFFSAIKKLGMSGYVMSSHKNTALVDDDDFVIENRPNRFDKSRGARFHLGQIKYGLGIIKTAIQYKADYMVISSGTHWFMLWPLRLFGIKVIPSIHCVLWPKYGERKWSVKVIDFFNGFFLRYGTFNVIVVSKEIAKQLKALNVETKKIHQFSPYYPRHWFEKIAAPKLEKRPFRLLYIGRMEKVKGIFDLFEAYKTLTSEGLYIEIDFCGNGSAFEGLKQLSENDESARCHGHCNREKILRIMGESHIVVVPTTTAFVEGFNKVVVESVLSGRPVVTSDVCPAIEDVLPAVAECIPDNVNSYIENIRHLYEDSTYYESKQKACLILQDKFYEETNSWGYLLSTLIETKNEK